MSLKSSLLALANNIGMCQENARSIKQALAGGLAEISNDVSYDEYTEDETEVGTWIDGKKIYRKYVKVEAASLTSTETALTHGISNVDHIVGVDGIVIKGGSGTTPLTTYHSNSTWACGIYNLSNTGFTFYVGSNLKTSVDHLDIFFTYTKTS